ncbi:MAG: N-acetyl-gamma-glutamyl-phosphate reductase [Euryarchaeota archaeon RBG_19FT_COMBO_69_17]|nr:MAG: N-acetyl-gamma-glutamyl-phosphate reductase [Euryarchaeota archaeon RBG_19FT_COMBO_69_17]
MRVSVVGASGYTGGEALRVLLGHPRVEVAQAVSESFAGKPVWKAHPNLRRVTDLAFSAPDELRPADALLLALPHGTTMRRLAAYASKAGLLVDLSADFRLRAAEDYARYYEVDHPASAEIGTFVYGLPELHRSELKEAARAAVAGCTAAASILALAPLVRSGLVGRERVVVDAETGSSAGGREVSRASHHPERSGAMRLYAPTGHRHTAEIEQELGLRGRVHLTIHAVEAVRGLLATAHAFPEDGVDRKALWRIYREAYGAEPFVRIVEDPTGIHRYPDPKILAGSNFCDVGFASEQGRIVVSAAIDNLMKGAAGNAVQCLNLMAGFGEREGLDFPGIHPA